MLFFEMANVNLNFANEISQNILRQTDEWTQHMGHDGWTCRCHGFIFGLSTISLPPNCRRNSKMVVAANDSLRWAVCWSGNSWELIRKIWFLSGNNNSVSVVTKTPSAAKTLVQRVSIMFNLRFAVYVAIPLCVYIYIYIYWLKWRFRCCKREFPKHRASNGSMNPNFGHGGWNCWWHGICGFSTFCGLTIAVENCTTVVAAIEPLFGVVWWSRRCWEINRSVGLFGKQHFGDGGKNTSRETITQTCGQRVPIVVV